MFCIAASLEYSIGMIYFTQYLESYIKNFKVLVFNLPLLNSNKIKTKFI
jgi:hypothetical protein